VRQWSSILSLRTDVRAYREKLRTVLPFTVGIRDSVVQLVSILGSVVRVGGAHVARSSACEPRHSKRRGIDSKRRVRQMKKGGGARGEVQRVEPRQCS
jgi:hypothetical protein